MKKSWLQIILFSSLFAALDQFSKASTLDLLGNSSIEYLDGLLHFEIHMNYGIAFGLPIPLPLILVLNVILLVTIVYFFCKEVDLNKSLAKLPLSLIMGGAFANIIDRFMHGAVVDFIGIGSWPYYNLADSGIVLGILLLILFHGKINRINYSNGRTK